MNKSPQKLHMFLAALLLLSSRAWAQECSDKEYSVFKQYDAYLDANPTISDDTARATFATKQKMRPAALKDLYFRCLFRWKDQEPNAVKKAAEGATKSMAAGGESPLTLGHSCNTLGYRYGHTATSTMLGRKPNIGWNFSMPERCKNQASTDTGIRAGATAASK